MPPDAHILAESPDVDADASARPLDRLPGWVTPEYLEQTRRVWQPHYSKLLTDDDVVEIVHNVSGLLSVLLARPATVSCERPEQNHKDADRQQRKGVKGKRRKSTTAPCQR